MGFLMLRRAVAIPVLSRLRCTMILVFCLEPTAVWLVRCEVPEVYLYLLRADLEYRLDSQVFDE